MSLLAGGALLTLGLLLRTWASGYPRNEFVLGTSGPYAYLRYPLIVGGFLTGLGVTVAGGLLFFIILFTAFYGFVNIRASLRCDRILEERFGAEYHRHRESVSLLPWRRLSRPPEAEPSHRFSRQVRRENRTFEADLIMASCYLILIIRVLKAVFASA